MHEPVRFERGRKLLFALQERPPTVEARARKGLDADQALAEIALSDADCLVGRAVINQVDLGALSKEMLQTAGDKPLLVVGGQNGYDTHGRAPPGRKSKITRRSF